MRSGLQSTRKRWKTATVNVLQSGYRKRCVFVPVDIRKRIDPHWRHMRTCRTNFKIEREFQERQFQIVSFDRGDAAEIISFIVIWVV